MFKNMTQVFYCEYKNTDYLSSYNPLLLLALKKKKNIKVQQ